MRKSKYFDNKIRSLSSSERAKNRLQIFDKHCTLFPFFLAHICCRSTVSADVRTGGGVEPKWTAVDKGQGRGSKCLKFCGRHQWITPYYRHNLKLKRRTAAAVADFNIHQSSIIEFETWEWKSTQKFTKTDEEIRRESRLLSADNLYGCKICLMFEWASWHPIHLARRSAATPSLSVAFHRTRLKALEFRYTQLRCTCPNDRHLVTIFVQIHPKKCSYKLA
jgi:hypothetical protein